MVKRKEVKIDEEQIRRVMAGDIPASVLENRYGSNAADSQKEDDKKPETENRSGIPAKSDKVEVPGSGVSGGEEEAPSPVLREKTHRKKNSLQEYPEHLFGNNVVKERRQTYVSSENYERVRTLLSVIAPTVSISCYIDNAMNDTGCQNHTCLVLTGDKQGQFKTWWLDNLCPSPLKNYLFTGKIDPQSKDILTLIAEYLFINIDDQLKELNKQNENALKNLITTPAVKYRRPYDIYIEEYPHLASFMASVNGNEFLTDPTGNRRFLPFEVLLIDKPTAESINIDNVYSEIMYLYRQGVRYWFNDTEIEELHLTNAEFEVQTVEFEMLMQYFEKPTEEEESLFFMTTAQILTCLRDVCPMQLSEKRLGEALRKAGFKRVQKRISNWNYSVYGYRIKPISIPYTDNDYG